MGVKVHYTWQVPASANSKPRAKRVPVYKHYTLKYQALKNNLHFSHHPLKNNEMVLDAISSWGSDSAAASILICIVQQLTGYIKQFYPFLIPLTTTIAALHISDQNYEAFWDSGLWPLQFFAGSSRIFLNACYFQEEGQWAFQHTTQGDKLVPAKGERWISVSGLEKEELCEHSSPGKRPETPDCKKKQNTPVLLL